MRRLSVTISVLFFIFLSTYSQSQTEEDEVLKIIRKVNDYWQKNYSPKVNAFWDNAAYHIGNMELIF